MSNFINNLRINDAKLIDQNFCYSLFFSKLREIFKNNFVILNIHITIKNCNNNFRLNLNKDKINFASDYLLFRNEFLNLIIFVNYVFFGFTSLKSNLQYASQNPFCPRRISKNNLISITIICVPEYICL